MFGKSNTSMRLQGTPVWVGLLFFLFTTPFLAQTKSPEDLDQLIERFRSEERASEQLLIKKAIPESIQQKDGTLVKPIGFSPEGILLYYKTYTSLLAQNTQTHAVNRQAQLALPLRGQAQVVGIWDAGGVFDQHQELAGRVFQFDQSDQVNGHTTEVSSVLLGKGVRAGTQGMLPEGNGRVYDWNADRVEVAEAVSGGLSLSNHSYGIKSENVPDWYFGCYISAARDWDALMFAAPHYLLVNAAGNSRGLAHNQDPLFGAPGEGFDELLGFSVSKNSLTVGSAHLDWSAEGVRATVSSFSTIGPADDGRIKPDLVSDGNGLETATAGGAQAYTLSSGTSMAAPAVTGGLAMLKEYANRLELSDLKAASLKGLALHTASDLGEDGPDYEMGWGAFNGLSGIHFLQQLGYSSLLEEHLLEEGETHAISLYPREGEVLRISISWTDPAGEAQRLDANNPVAALVNDLDIRLSKNGQVFYPWTLDRNNPKAPAGRGDNTVDPYERIELSVSEGEYLLQVSHKGELLTGSQAYTLLISGASFSECNLETPSSVEVTEASQEELLLQWNTTGADAYRIGYRQLGEEWNYVRSETTTHRFTDLDWGGFYEFELYSECGKAYRSEPSAPLVVHYQEGDFYQTLSASNVPRVFPNPAGSFLMTSTPLQGKKYQIVNASGTVVSKGSGEGAISTSLLSSGLYFLQIETEGTDWTALKFYKE